MTMTKKKDILMNKDEMHAKLQKGLFRNERIK